MMMIMRVWMMMVMTVGEHSENHEDNDGCALYYDFDSDDNDDKEVCG